MQRAWLEFDTGFWLLLTDGTEKGAGMVRAWNDQVTALSELSSEGWTISRPYRKRRRQRTNSKLGFRAYALERTIQ